MTSLTFLFCGPMTTCIDRCIDRTTVRARIARWFIISHQNVHLSINSVFIKQIICLVFWSSNFKYVSNIVIANEPKWQINCPFRILFSQQFARTVDLRSSGSSGDSEDPQLAVLIVFLMRAFQSDQSSILHIQNQMFIFYFFCVTQIFFMNILFKNMHAAFS